MYVLCDMDLPGLPFNLPGNESQGLATFLTVEADKADNRRRNQESEQESRRVPPEGSPDEELICKQIANHNDRYHERTEIGMLYKAPDFEVELEMK